jgi:CheY-like chemotaxis protein
MRIAHIARELNYYSGAGQGEMETVSLDQIAREALLLARPTLPATQLLEAELDELPGVMGNRRRLVQVAINLLNNAAHASSGRGLVRLRTRAEGEWMMLEVIDQGCGIPPGLQEKIFEPFFTTKPAGQGTGLGLWLARGIVDGHRGELSASSSPGRGTTFTMRLPRPTEATRVAIEQLSSRPPEARSARIMVVDDQPAIRRTMERLLAPRHQVVLCDGGQEALKTLELDDDFDLIFCDMQMPFVNGAIFYQRLRSHQPQLAPRVVFMSGLDVSADLGVDLPGPHLEKPFSPATLNKVINLRLQALDFPEASCAASR